MPRKKMQYKIWVLLFLLSVLVSVGVSGYDWWISRKSRRIKYEAFGIPIPENFSIHGIDVSRYQQIIAWEAVKEMKEGNIAIGFAFIKATEGIGNTDPMFYRNWKKSRQAGIIRGAYHFFVPTKEGRAQAKNFIKTVRLEKNDLPPVVDIEQAGGIPAPVIRKEIKEWLSVVESYYHTKPIIYTHVDFYTNYLGREFDSYPLWVAHYFQDKQPRINRSWMFWQHNEEGRVNGILSKVDFNVFRGDSTAFLDLLLR